MTKKKVFNLV